VEWQKLHEARHEPDIDVSALGHDLFLSQFLLQHVVPNEHLQAVGAQILALQESPCDLRDQEVVSSATSPKQRSFNPKQQDQLRTLSKLSHGSQSDNSDDTVSRKSLHSQVPVTVTSPAITHDFPPLA
jgi:hypothetical protein